MKKLFTKENILFLFALFIPLCCFIGLGFDLVGTKLNSNRYIENGFMLLDFKSFFITSAYGWAVILLAVINWLLLIACITVVGLLFLGKFKLKSKLNGLEIASISVGLTFSLLYLIEGAVYKSINNDTLYGDFYTIAFIPFIICALLFIAYMVLKFKMPSKFEKSVDTLEKDVNEQNILEKNIGEQNIEQNEGTDITV